MNNSTKLMRCIAVVCIFLTGGLACGQEPSLKEYIHGLLTPPVFPEDLVLHIDIQKKVAACVVLDEVRLNEQAHEMYSHSKKYQLEFPTIEEFLNSLRETLLNGSNFVKTTMTLTTSAHGQHLLEYAEEDAHVIKEVIQYRPDGKGWQSLQIDHDRQTASLEKGKKGIFTDYRETGIFDSLDRLWLVIFFRTLPDQDQEDAINALCKGKTLVAESRTLKLESRKDAVPSYLLLTCQNTKASSSIELKMDPKRIGILLGKKSLMPRFYSQWNFTRNTKNQDADFAFPQKTIFEKYENSERLKEREVIILKGASSSAEWNLQQLWEDKMNEIKDYNVSIWQ